MIASRNKVLEEMKELTGIITMYQEAYPENPIWQQIGKKDKKTKKVKETEVQ